MIRSQSCKMGGGHRTRLGVVSRAPPNVPHVMGPTGSTFSKSSPTHHFFFLIAILTGVRSMCISYASNKFQRFAVNIVPIVNSSVLYTEKLVQSQVKCSYYAHTHTHTHKVGRRVLGRRKIWEVRKCLLLCGDGFMGVFRRSNPSNCMLFILNMCDFCI